MNEERLFMIKFHRQQLLLIGTLTLLMASCGGLSRTDQTIPETRQVSAVKVQATAIELFDTNRDIESLTMQELRILRSFVLARYGTLFDESDLRNYWKQNTAWYDTLSRSQYQKNNIAELVLPADEQAFVDRIDRQMEYLQQYNYVRTDGDTVANIMNVVNMFQYAEISQQQIMDGLAMNNHAAADDSLDQLFQTYQRNDSLRLPNFITTDLLLQLSHVYYAYMLRTVEQAYFMPMLADICLSLYSVSTAQAGKAATEEMKDIAGYNAAFFAIPYELLTGKRLKYPDRYQTQVEEELAYLAQQEDHQSSFLPVRADFPYSAFMPYGHYTHTAAFRRYFKALRWLQFAFYCPNDKTQLKQAVFIALMLNSAKGKSDEPVIGTYRRLFESMSCLLGQPAGLSLLNLSILLQQERINSLAAVTDVKTLAKIEAVLKKIPVNGQPSKNDAGCRNGIYLLPQPAYVDDGILSAMTDNTARPFPKVLDVFAALGSQAASDKLLLSGREDTLWAAYPATLARMKSQMAHFGGWNQSLYNKWMECLLAISRKQPHAPPFMQRQPWMAKNLETASASWVKLKHDMLLYGVIPDHPEPLDTTAVRDDIPEPVTLGYVEPNMFFWKNLLEWIDLTENTLNSYRLVTDTLNRQTARLRRYVAFMEEASRRELNNDTLTVEQYRFISHVGDSIEQFTLSMVQPGIDRWSWTSGTGRSVATIKDIYRQNSTLYAAAGNASNIYVIVEISGYLYLAKGAVFRYYEFPVPENTALDEEDWQSMLLNMAQDTMAVSK